MSNSKHAHLRYNILDHCFANKRFTFAQLKAYVNEKIAEYYPGEGISTRTLREDLQVFRDEEEGFGAPLPENIRILAYAVENFSIAQRPLLAEEQEIMVTAQQLLERFENHPKFNRLAEALIRFQEGEAEEASDAPLLFFDHNEAYKGIQHLKPLYFAIKKKEVLQLRYQGFKDAEESTYEFHPHVLKQYNRRWFVFGLNASRGIAQWSIPLDDRLLDFVTLEAVSYIESTTDWNAFFRNMVGVVRPSEASVEKVVLQFYNGREKYFKTKPFHPDYEEFFEPEKQDQVWFETIINKELVQQLLSYGKDVAVLAPEVLQSKMKEEVARMQQHYL